MHARKWKLFIFEASMGFPWGTLCFAISAGLKPRFGMALTCGEESGCALDVSAHTNPSKSITRRRGMIRRGV